MVVDAECLFDLRLSNLPDHRIDDVMMEIDGLIDDDQRGETNDGKPLFTSRNSGVQQRRQQNAKAEIVRPVLRLRDL